MFSAVSGGANDKFNSQINEDAAPMLQVNFNIVCAQIFLKVIVAICNECCFCLPLTALEWFKSSSSTGSRDCGIRGSR